MRAHVDALEASTAVCRPGSGKVRRYAEVFDAARSWRRAKRIVARVEAGPQGVNACPVQLVLALVLTRTARLVT